MFGAYPEFLFLVEGGGTIGSAFDFLGVFIGVCADNTGAFLAGVLAFIGVFRLAFNGVCKCCGFDFSDFIGVRGTGFGLDATLIGTTKGKDFLGVFVATKLGVFLGVFATEDDTEETEDGTLN